MWLTVCTRLSATPLRCRMTYFSNQTLHRHGRRVGNVYIRNTTKRAIANSTHASYSTLYTPPKDGERVPFISRPDIDISEIMNNVDAVEKNVEARNLTIGFPNLKRLWNEMQQYKVQVDELEEKKKQVNKLVKEVNKNDTAAEEKQRVKEHSKQLRNDLKKMKKLHSAISEELFGIVLQLPNSTHSDTPVGPLEVVTHSSGDKLEFEDWMKNHVELGIDLDILSDQHTLVHPGACYLKKEAALLEWGLQFWMSERLKENEFLQLSCPDMFKPLVVEGCGLDPRDPSQVYSVIDRGDILHLTGVSIMSFAANFMMTVIEHDSLPHRCFTYGRNYNPFKESASFTSLCNIHQSSMVHLCGMTTNSFSQSNQLMEEYLSMLQSLYSQLELHIRTVNVPVQQLKPYMHRKSSIQMWLPSEHRYHEVACVYNCTDFISRRLKFRHPSDPSQPAAISRNRQYCHTVFGIGMDVHAVIAILLESYQEKGGAVPVPSVLLPFMFGCERIDAKSLS